MTPGKPTSARITNYWLGGTNHTAADREVAAELEAACPQARQMVADSRLFTARAVGWAADKGIGQYLDLGAGMPAGATVHRMARAVRWDARTAYVDSDPEAVDWLRDVMPCGRDEGVAVARADLSRPADVMSDPPVLDVIDPRERTCLLATLVLHLWSAEQAHAIVLGYARLLAAGSLIVVSVPCAADEAAWERIAKVVPVAANFTGGQFRTLFGGLEMVPPGTGPVRCLRPGWADMPADRSGGAYVMGGLARVP